MYKVLLVDDETFVLKGLQKLLLGFSSLIDEIRVAQNGIEALNCIQNFSADIIFTDIKMPGMDGMELIERLTQHNTKCKIIILSGYDNFSYAQKAIANNISAYLLKPIVKADLLAALDKAMAEISVETSQADYLHRLQQQLDNSLPLLKEKFFYELANGHYEKDTADFLGLEFHEGLYKIALMSPDTVFNHSFAASLIEKEKQIALLGLANSLAHGISANIHYHYFQLQHRICVLFTIDVGQSNNFLEAQLKQFQKRSQAENGNSISIGLSGTFEKIENFFVFLEQAFSSLKHKLYMGDNSLVFYDNIACIIKPPVFVSNAQLKNGIYQALVGAQSDKVLQLLQSTKQNLSSQRTLPSELIRTMCIDILSIFTIFAYEQNIDSKELIHQNQMPSERIFVANTLDEIFDIIFQTHENINKCLELRNENQAASTVFTIKKYVSDHIEEDISLEILSNVVYLTPNYISFLFRRETNIPFKEYVLNAKMQRAKKLLCENNLKIYEVAQAVGYKSIPYFSKIFKKATGVYPSDYHEK